MKKSTILQINGANGGGGANQLVQQLHDGLTPNFNMSALVESKTGTQVNIDTFAKNPDTIYKKYAYYVWWASVLSGLQFKTAKYLLGRNYKNIANHSFYKNANLIHLHNLHGNYFNLELLPQISKEKKIIWTLQDMWSLTGHCAHSLDCQKWQNKQCKNCPDLWRYSPIAIDTSNYFFNLKKKIYQGCNLHLVAPSNWLAVKVKKSILKDKPITVIYNGADTKVFKPYNKKKIRQELNLPQDKFIVLFAANFGTKNPWKGGNYFEQLVKENPFSNTLFLTLGNKQETKSTNLHNLPFVTDRVKMAKYLSAADVLFYPAIADTCPLTVIESLACGTPVVSFKTGGIPELIKHSQTGYLTKTNNLDELVKGVELFQNNPNKLNQASKLASLDVSKRLSLKITIEKYENLYTSILNE